MKVFLPAVERKFHGLFYAKIMQMNQKNKIIILLMLVILFLSFACAIINQNSFLLCFDNQIATLENNLHTPTLNTLALGITKIGDPIESFFIILIFSIFLLIKKEKKSFYILITSTALGGALMELIKVIVQRPRPISHLLFETDFSFPSGHATIGTVFLLASILLIAPLIKKTLYKKLFIVITSILFLLIALSRIYLSVHFASDIIGGILLGSLMYLLSSLIICHKKENML